MDIYSTYAKIGKIKTHGLYDTYCLIFHGNTLQIIGVLRTPMLSTRPVFRNPQFAHSESQ